MYHNTNLRETKTTSTPDSNKRSTRKYGEKTRQDNSIKEEDIGTKEYY
jgi:hypothetical protein